MTYSELNSLFNTIALGLGMKYEEGDIDQINTVYSQQDKYPLCYTVYISQVGNSSTSDGPESLNVDIYDVQIFFLDISGNTNQAPDLNNLERRYIVNAMFTKAKNFLFNLYESEVVPEGTFIENWQIKPLRTFQDFNSSTGASLEFTILTLSSNDCEVIVSAGIGFEGIGSFVIS